jgi:hypothetical protein
MTEDMTRILIAAMMHVQAMAILILLVAFQLKHFLADFPLQTQRMLGKFKERGWFAPLAAHAGVHALGTLSVICLFYYAVIGPIDGRRFLTALSLALFDFCVHFIMDRIKASPRLMGRWKSLSQTEFASAKREILMYEDLELLKLNSQSYKDICTIEETARLAKRRLRGNRLFWQALGFDQMVHHFTHYAIIAWLVLR